MTLLRLSAFLKIPLNTCSFWLRQTIHWSLGKPQLRQEAKEELFAYLGNNSSEAEKRAAELCVKYGTEPLAEMSTRSVYRQNLYLLDLLDKITFGLPLPFEAGRGISALDVGAQDWRYVFALERWLRWHNSADTEVKLCGIELDPYELSAGWHSRFDYATAYVEQTENVSVRYEASNFLKWQEYGYDVLFMFYPLVQRYQQLLWGLPLHLFNPVGMVQKAAESTRAGGWLVVFCHSVPEHKRFKQICHDSRAFVLLREGELLSELVDYYEETVNRRYSIWLKT